MRGASKSVVDEDESVRASGKVGELADGLGLGAGRPNRNIAVDFVAILSYDSSFLNFIDLEIGFDFDALFR